MAWIPPINNLAQYGIIRDIPPQELPPNAWTDGNGIIFGDGGVSKGKGYGEIYATSPRPPYFLLPGKFSGGSDFWMIPESSDTLAWYLDGIMSGNHTDISPVTVSTTITLAGSASNVWTGTVFNNEAVINNGTDHLLNWVSTTSRATFMSNAVSFTCASIRSFKNFLVAVDVTKGGTRYPQMVKWSHSASTGSNPSWDETDPTLDAGEYSLSDTSDICVDSFTLRDSHIVYKEKSIWGMQFIGAPYIFRFFLISGTHGIMSRNCVAEVDGRHVALTSDDVLIHDGQLVESIAEKRVREDLFPSINSAYASTCFVAPDYRNHELWVCYPVSNSLPDTAWVWNWRDNTWGKRSLGIFSHVQSGSYQGAGGTWASDGATWASDQTPWDVGLVAPLFMGAQPKSTKLQQLNFTEQENGSNFTAFIERVALDLGDDSRRKLVKKVRLHVSGTAGGQLSVQIGSHDTPDAAPSYSGAQTHTIGTTLENDFLVQGRYIAIKISSNSNITWKLHSYEINAVMAGEY